MKIEWLGHASFLITSDNGIRIITDPYHTGDQIKYAGIKETADIVTISHDHVDHNNIEAIEGNPQIIRDADGTEIKGIKIHSVATFHDENMGKDRGNNNVFCFEIDGINICHLGDLGHKLSDKEVSQIGEVDVLLTPMAGYYTIDAEVATEVGNTLKPKVIIPMHFKNDRCDFPVSTIDPYLKGKENVVRMDASEVEFQAGKFDDITKILVLKPAL